MHNCIYLIFSGTITVHCLCRDRMRLRRLCPADFLKCLKKAISLCYCAYLLRAKGNCEQRFCHKIFFFIASVATDAALERSS